VATDVLTRASAAWWAGSEELERATNVPGQSSSIGASGVLSIGDARVERGAITVATAKLRTLLGELQTATTTARAWGAEIGLDDLDLPTRIERVEAHTRHLRTLRERYEASWRGRR
jgi:hypothetical protein